MPAAKDLRESAQGFLALPRQRGKATCSNKYRRRGWNSLPFVQIFPLNLRCTKHLLKRNIMGFRQKTASSDTHVSALPRGLLSSVPLAPASHHLLGPRLVTSTVSPSPGGHHIPRESSSSPLPAPSYSKRMWQLKSELLEPACLQTSCVFIPRTLGGRESRQVRTARE